MIELLVVIAIIGILSAMSLSIFAKVQDKARTTQCLSNLRQIAIGALAYGSDHDGHLLPMDTISPSHKTWMTYLSEGSYVPVPQSPSATVMADKSVFRCPSDSKMPTSTIPKPTSRTDPAGANPIAESGTDDSGKTVIYHVSYAVNGASTNEEQYPLGRDPADSGNTVSHRLGDIPFPSKTVLFIDGVYYLNTVDARINLRHGNKTQANMVFLDGHGGTFKDAEIPRITTAKGADYPRFRVDYSDPVTGQ